MKMKNNPEEVNAPLCVRVLIVEDTEAEQRTWQHIIDVHNSQVEHFGFLIEPKYAKSQAEALEFISEFDYDAAIVDINLQQGEGAAPNSDGNEVVSTLLDAELAVVAVFTGETQQVDTPEWAKPFVKTFQKGADEDENSGSAAVMEWLKKQVPMVQPIRRAAALIRHEMVHLFTRSIWPRWNEWTEANGSKINPYLELALARHLASHIHAALLDGSDQKVHPEEWYFVPPIRNGIRTGDLVKIGDADFAVVITPRCDLANTSKVENIQLAKCKIVVEKWKELCDALEAAELELGAELNVERKSRLQKKLKSAQDELGKYVRGPKANQHFLPSVRLADGGRIGPFLVQFDHITSISTEDAHAMEALTANRLASLTSEFLPSFVERLGAFFSRIGTPNYSH